MFQAVAHAFAKAAMFLAAGLIAEAVGHDRIAELRGIGRALPVTCFAFGIAALSLIGVPPTGGFFTKWLLLSASAATGQWWWIVIVLAGGLLAGGYMFRFLSPALAEAETPLALTAPVSRGRELIVLALAILALLLGVMPQKPLQMLQIGRAQNSTVALAMNLDAMIQTLPLKALALPVAMLLACVFRPVRQRLPQWLWILPVPALLTALFALGGPAFVFDWAPYRLMIALDAPGAMLLGTSALLWIAAGILRAGIFSAANRTRRNSPFAGCSP